MRIRSFLMTASAAALGLGLAGPAMADSNTLFVEQIGANNFVGANQNGANNETYAAQNGNFNTGNASTATTGSSPGASNNNQALLQQTGNRNSGGWSSQGISDGNFSNNIIGVVQETNRNFAGLTFQNGTANSSQIFLRQTGGDSNYIGSGAPIGTAPGTTQNNKVGNGAQNGATQPLSSNGVDTSLLEGSSVYSVPVTGSQNGSVHGTGNRVGVLQDGAVNALALNVQGNGNRVGGYDEPGVLGSPVDLNSFAGTFFSGTPEIDPGENQFGVQDLATQDGNFNTGVIAINGDNNAVGFSQTGSNNVNEVYVNGTGNLAVANQL